MDDFKCRASSAGKLATMPRAKKDQEAGILSKTVQTYLKDWKKEILYGQKHEIHTKYFAKGLTVEDEAIDKAIEWLDLPFVLKNEDHFENIYFTGTPDLILEKEIIDTKCSWDCFTFPTFENEIPDKSYMYQAQVYMHLTGREKSRVVYILLNTPKNVAPWETHHDYSKIPAELRHKEFSFEYDPEIIEFLKSQVIKSRKFIKNLK